QTLKEVFTVPEQSKEVKICIKEILNMALPVLYFRGETAASFFSSTNETRLLVAFVGTKTVAEILMAFLDKRPTSWVPGDRHPVGSACVPSPPENGIGFTWNQTECDFVTYLKEKLLNAEDLKTLSEGEIVEIINDELEYVKTSGDPFPFQHYCLIELGDQQQEHSFSGLMDKFKDLLFLALDRKSVREERRLTRPLVDLFPGNNRKEIV
ncbi:MAG: hypothetical protein ACE5FU_01995, partial [Nitrospinota bacterium]